MLPPFSASLCRTVLCSHMLICAESPPPEFKDLLPSWLRCLDHHSTLHMLNLCRGAWCIEACSSEGASETPRPLNGISGRDLKGGPSTLYGASRAQQTAGVLDPAWHCWRG